MPGQPYALLSSFSWGASIFLGSWTDVSIGRPITNKKEQHQTPRRASVIALASKAKVKDNKEGKEEEENEKQKDDVFIGKFPDQIATSQNCIATSQDELRLPRADENFLGSFTLERASLP